MEREERVTTGWSGFVANPMCITTVSSLKWNHPSSAVDRIIEVTMKTWRTDAGQQLQTLPEQQKRSKKKKKLSATEFTPKSSPL